MQETHPSLRNRNSREFQEAEIAYEGKSFDEWMKQLRAERSSVKRFEAFNALTSESPAWDAYWEWWLRSLNRWMSQRALPKLTSHDS